MDVLYALFKTLLRKQTKVTTTKMQMNKKCQNKPFICRRWYFMIPFICLAVCRKFRLWARNNVRKYDFFSAAAFEVMDLIFFRKCPTNEDSWFLVLGYLWMLSSLLLLFINFKWFCCRCYLYYPFSLPYITFNIWPLKSRSCFSVVAPKFLTLSLSAFLTLFIQL